MGVTAIAKQENPPRGGSLVVQARRGDFAAFESLYHRHVGRVHAICLRMTADPSRAEDLTQEAFVRAWQNLASLRGESEFPFWLRKLAVNVVLADRRARGRREGKEKPLEESVGLEHSQPAPGPGIDLEKAIANLPQGARDVFVLHDVEGYRHREIAELLQIAAGTSKAQLHRARRLLREALRS